MTEKLKVLENLFLPEWNTVAIICEGGKVYIELMRGRFFTKDEVREGLGTGFNNDFYKSREDLFDDVYEYYLNNLT